MVWIVDEEARAHFMDLVTKSNLAIQSTRIMAVCTYPDRVASLGRCPELSHGHGHIYVERDA